MQHRVYHGTKHNFSSFDPSFLGKGLDQYGSGFYFTSYKPIAEGYASGNGYLITADVIMNKPIIIDEVKNKSTKDLTQLQVNKLINMCSRLEEYISDNYDVEYEGKTSAMRQIYDIYGPSDNILNTLNMISNDIYGNSLINEFNENVRKVTGYDGIMIKRLTDDSEFYNLVVWFMDSINIINKEEYLSESFNIFLGKLDIDSDLRDSIKAGYSSIYESLWYPPRKKISLKSEDMTHRERIIMSIISMYKAMTYEHKILMEKRVRGGRVEKNVLDHIADQDLEIYKDYVNDLRSLEKDAKYREYRDKMLTKSHDWKSKQIDVERDTERKRRIEELNNNKDSMTDDDYRYEMDRLI